MIRPLLTALLAVAGLAAGPALRVVIIWLSVPPGEPWRRACPACGTPVGWRAAVWLVAGLCPGCGARLGPAPWSVEAAAVVLLGLLAAVVHPGLVLAAVGLLAVCVIPLAFIDLAARRLPDVLTGLAYAVVALCLLLAAADGGDWSPLGRALLGGAAFAGFCLVLFVISPGGMGAGDVKLATSLGTALGWFGWAAVFGGVLAGFLLAAACSTGLLIWGRVGRKQQIAFGPFMITGALLVILAVPLGGFLPHCTPNRTVRSVVRDCARSSGPTVICEGTVAINGSRAAQGPAVASVWCQGTDAPTSPLAGGPAPGAHACATRSAPAARHPRPCHAPAHRP